MTDKLSNEDWTSRIESYRKSHMSLSKWCDKNNININQMKLHLNKNLERTNKEITFIPATVIDAGTPTVVSTININIGKASITVDGTTDMNLLRKVINCLS